MGAYSDGTGNRTQRTGSEQQSEGRVKGPSQRSEVENKGREASKRPQRFKTKRLMIPVAFIARVQ